MPAKQFWRVHKALHAAVYIIVEIWRFIQIYAIPNITSFQLWLYFAAILCFISSSVSLKSKSKLLPDCILLKPGMFITQRTTNIKFRTCFTNQKFGKWSFTLHNIIEGKASLGSFSVLMRFLSHLYSQTFNPWLVSSMSCEFPLLLSALWMFREGNAV